MMDPTAENERRWRLWDACYSPGHRFGPFPKDVFFKAHSRKFAKCLDAATRRIGWAPFGGWPAHSSLGWEKSRMECQSAIRLDRSACDHLWRVALSGVASGGKQPGQEARYRTWGRPIGGMLRRNGCAKSPSIPLESVAPAVIATHCRPQLENWRRPRRLCFRHPDCRMADCILSPCKWLRLTLTHRSCLRP